MEILAPATLAPACRHTGLRIVTTRPTEFIDVTDHIAAFVDEAGLDTGLVNVQTLHTTTAVVVNEDEPLLHADFAALLAQTAPQLAAYRHDDLGARNVNVEPGERRNGHAHCRALLLGTSVALNVARGRIQLGRWQRIFLVELDGPRTRELSVVALGGFGR